MGRGRGKHRSPLDDGHGFLRSVRLLRDSVPSFDAYPFSIPAVRELDEIEIDRRVHAGSIETRTPFAGRRT
jgi:hypothetical protein